MRSVKISEDFARLILAARPEKLDGATVVAFEAIRWGLEKNKRLKEKSAPRRKAKAEKRAEKEAAWQSVRAAVLVRAGHVCEACGYVPVVLDCDHFFGRSRAESIETVWAICRACHRDKTDNAPSARHWAEKFADHCHRYGYSDTAKRALRRFPEGA